MPRKQSQVWDTEKPTCLTSVQGGKQHKGNIYLWLNNIRIPCVGFFCLFAFFLFTSNEWLGHVRKYCFFFCLSTIQKESSEKPFLGNVNFPDVPIYALLALYLGSYSLVARLYLLLSLDKMFQSALVRKIQLNSQQNSQQDFVSLEEASQNFSSKQAWQNSTESFGFE